MLDYDSFVKKLDEMLSVYFNEQKDSIYCKKGCSACCEKGDYPLSEIELQYLMQGFIELDNDTKIRVQENFSKIEKGGVCPFLIDKACSVYPHRPIICRVHGLAYCYKDGKVKLPYCVNYGKNFSKSLDNGDFIGKPIKMNLDTKSILKDIDYGEIRNLYDWINK